MSFRPRLIPTLLLKGAGLVKTTRFKDPVYLGDPINIIKIFNDKEVDELILLDIQATPESRGPRLDFLAQVASECFMPVCYGGGVSTLKEIEAVLALGFEKVAINTQALNRPNLLTEGASVFGSQSIVASIDYKRGLLGRYETFTHCGKKGSGLNPVEAAKRMESAGAGEIFLNSIDRDGMMQGYDLALTRKVAEAVSIPVIASGGAGSLEDLGKGITEGKASAVAAGSFFVFQGIHRAVLINVPTPHDFGRSIGQSY